MKTIVPEYYKKFKCIAERCTHSCCIGWEIDIDPTTYEKYQNVSGKLGSRLKSCISTEGGSHFVLDENERCPFLNCNGLCDIITELGENALCQICADHPRFRSFFSSHTEMGLGLCCEEAARIIVTEKDKFTLPIIETDDEQEQFLFKFRQTVFDILQDREFSFDERVDNLFCYLGTDLPNRNMREWENTLLSLEILDDSWKDLIRDMDETTDTAGFDTEFEQLACYFVFRNLTDALDDGCYVERVKLCILFCKIIAAIAAKGGITTEAIIDVSRALSTELEYSDENIQTLLDILM